MQTRQTLVHEVLNRAIEVERIELMVALPGDADAIVERASRAFRNKDGTAKLMRGAVVVQTTRRAR